MRSTLSATGAAATDAPTCQASAVRCDVVRKGHRFIAVTLALTLAACSLPLAAGPSPGALVTPTASASAPSATRTPGVTATTAPSPSALPPATAPGSATPTTPASGPAPYCAVADVPTPNRDYAEHVRTYLDWTYALPNSYVPPDLVDAVSGSRAIPSPYAVETLGAADVMARRGDPAYSALLADAPGSAIRAVVYGDVVALRSAARAAGQPLVILSSYRSYALQELTFDYWVRVGGYAQALRTSARPGHSEHQLGTVIDFGDGIAAPWEYDDWATTEQGAWLASHAAEYGFVMSFVKGGTPVTCYDYEPWHYRWVGREIALRLTAAGTPLRVYQTSLR
jgi:D-alanyl-D-alanine carboxypeptidase